MSRLLSTTSLEVNSRKPSTLCRSMRRTVNLTDCGRANLDSAIRVFQDRRALRPEQCRALLKRSMALDKMGDEEAAKMDREASVEMYRELYPKFVRPAAVLTKEAVDEMVAFWSR